MNHICRPQTCHKGRWAKIKFCRMFFWHWAQRAHKKTGQPVMARLHGHTLHQRWVAGDWPPVQQVPPQAGMPSLERNHAFHCKMSPGVFLSARCNHDLSILLRLPVLSERMKSVMAHFANGLRDEQEEDDKQEAQRFYEESVDVMVQLIVDHEYYASDYSTKSQPHAANLLQTLHDSLVRHNRFAAEHDYAGKANVDLARAQRLLQSFICATNRRLHKGMPVYAYLLGRPSHYCSYTFQPWSMQEVHGLFWHLLQEF